MHKYKFKIALIQELSGGFAHLTPYQGFALDPQGASVAAPLIPGSSLTFKVSSLTSKLIDNPECILSYLADVDISLS